MPLAAKKRWAAKKGDQASSGQFSRIVYLIVDPWEFQISFCFSLPDRQHQSPLRAAIGESSFGNFSIEARSHIGAGHVLLDLAH
jgi:hypothetical protein